jgi:hypothetical protein
MPVEVEIVHVGQDLPPAIGRHGLKHHRLAAQAHVRLHALDAARTRHRADRLRDLHFVWRDIDGARAPGTERLAVLWLLTFRRRQCLTFARGIVLLGRLTAGTGATKVNKWLPFLVEINPLRNRRDCGRIRRWQ